MSEEQKKKLFPYFAYTYSKQLNPDRYGNISDYEQWSTLLDEHPEDMKAIIEAASKLPDDEWENLDQQYASEDVQVAKQGAKLQNLKNLQKYKKGSFMKKKKCECGCDLVQSKEKGGKIVEKCSCGCKQSYKQGGSIKMDWDNVSIPEDLPVNTQKWERRLKSKSLRKFKK